MALNEVGLLVYSQGFCMSRDETIIRELAFCDWTGHHHALFKYLLLLACRTINYPRRPRLASIVRPGRCMACRLNRTRLTTAMHSIPTIRSRTISPAGVNSISPPAGSARGVHAQWTVSMVARTRIFVPHRGPGRAGLQGLAPSSHRHGQCHGHQ